MLDLTIIREHLSYDRDSGEIRWFKSPGGMRGKAGKVAGCIEKQRASNKFYRRIRLSGVPMFAHRLAWLLMTGREVPDGLQIDHINGDGLDNRWSNLRVVSHEQNQQNLRRAPSHSSTGFLGVREQDGKFMARIYVNRQRICLGRFPTAEQAYEAYLEAKRKLHPGNTL